MHEEQIKRLETASDELIRSPEKVKQEIGEPGEISADIESLQNQKVEVIFLQVKREMKNWMCRPALFCRCRRH